MKMYQLFLRITSSKVDRLTSNQDQNDRRSILHISSDTFHQRKYFVLW